MLITHTWRQNVLQIVELIHSFTLGKCIFFVLISLPSAGGKNALLIWNISRVHSTLHQQSGHRACAMTRIVANFDDTNISSTLVPRVRVHTLHSECVSRHHRHADDNDDKYNKNKMWCDNRQPTKIYFPRAPTTHHSQSAKHYDVKFRWNQFLVFISLCTRQAWTRAQVMHKWFGTRQTRDDTAQCILYFVFMNILWIVVVARYSTARNGREWQQRTMYKITSSHEQCSENTKM